MKTILRSIIALALTTPFTFADGWMTDWEAAKAKAKAENKPILINFTGTDWYLVLMEVDFPKKKEQSAELKKQNKALDKEFAIEGYPTVYLLDAEGKKISDEIGYREGGPDAYTKHLQTLIDAGKKPETK
jgi:thioredoxin-related protein